MNLLCRQCNALLAAGNVYCLNCGTPVADSVLDTGEQETVVIRPRQDKPAWFALAVVAVLGVLLLGGFLLWRADKGQLETGSRIPTTTPVAGPSEQATVTPKSTEPIAAAKRTPPPTAATPANRQGDRVQGEKSKRDRPTVDGETPASAYNTATVGNYATNRPPLVRGWPAYDAKGRPIRAICNNGRPSYWQYDRFAVCGANGGVAELFW